MTTLTLDHIALITIAKAAGLTIYPIEERNTWYSQCCEGVYPYPLLHDHGRLLSWDGDADEKPDEWNPATDWRAAGQVLERLRLRLRPHAAGWSAAPDDSDENWHCPAPTPQEAICQAALILARRAVET